MRLFIAIEFDSAVRGELAGLSDKLLASAVSGRPSRPENLHLTLAFLGELPAERLPAIRQCMAQSAAGELEIRFDRLGTFHRRGGDTWWLGVYASPELMALEARLRAALISSDFSVEDRAFRPHITLGREIKMPPDFDKNAIERPTLTQPVHEIVLMESTRDGGKLVYRPCVRTVL
ncbi:MAG: RNA 2',3'-cyclic phosphodiesterase [Oscillospiraceae bacterium]